MKMTRFAHFDCFSGISGDMVLGALVDAGVELGRLEAELRKLGLEGWGISAERVKRGPLGATRVNVDSREHHHHRGLTVILEMIVRAGIAPRAADRAKRIFTRLAEAEAKVHQVPIEQVHFHEVGAVDAIVDIVGAAIGFELLGIDEFSCSALDVGAGQVKTAHGLLPIPAPATAEMLKGAPAYSSGTQRELVTPTGAAIATTLASRFAEIPPMTLRAIGCGAGSAEIAEKPNVLRLLVGEGATAQAEAWDRSIAVIETNVDDMNPQVYGYFAERALEAGALDVFSTPAQMKKNRPGLLLTILCEPELAPKLADLVFRETTSIGVRVHEARRKCMERQIVAVATPYGEVRMKLSRMNGSVLNAQPEYEDCRRIAEQQGVPLKQVIAAASFAYQKQSQPAAAGAAQGAAPK